MNMTSCFFPKQLKTLKNSPSHSLIIFHCWRKWNLKMVICFFQNNVVYKILKQDNSLNCSRVFVLSKYFRLGTDLHEFREAKWKKKSPIYAWLLLYLIGSCCILNKVYRMNYIRKQVVCCKRVCLSKNWWQIRLWLAHSTLVFICKAIANKPIISCLQIVDNPFTK